MSETEAGEAAYPNYILEERKYLLKGEFEVPARVLDLLTSFVDSSVKPKYLWNNPPFRKVMKDGSYWQVRQVKLKVQVGEEIKERNAVCVYVVSWNSNGEACLLDDGTLILVVRYANRFDQVWTDPDTTEVKLKSKYRDGELPLFDVYRKLKFYKFIMSKTEVEKSETDTSQAETG